MKGLWTHQRVRRYGLECSYEIAAEWLNVCDLVEDWGCGTCWARRFIETEYRGVDGSGPWCDVVADLRTYRSSTQGLMMRHVLEHNADWRTILDNALGSFTRRMALVLFRPLGKAEALLWREDAAGRRRPDGAIPTYQLPGDELRHRLGDVVVSEQSIVRPPKHETVFLLQR